MLRVPVCYNEIHGIWGQMDKLDQSLSRIDRSIYIGQRFTDGQVQGFKRLTTRGPVISIFVRNYSLIIVEALNVVLKESIGNSKFEGIEVGKSSKVLISHLQYADDTLSFGNVNSTNLANLIKTLRCFEWAAGLKININKSKLIGLGLGEETTKEWEDSIGCGLERLPFKYLGLSIGQR